MIIYTIKIVLNIYQKEQMISQKQRGLQQIINKDLLCSFCHNYFIFLIQLRHIIINNMAISNIFKTKASSLAKVAALPVYRHPADLLNQHAQPYDLQKKQIQGQLQWAQANYYNQNHYELTTNLKNTRKEYRNLTEKSARNALAMQQYQRWNEYLNDSLKNPEMQLNELQKNQIYEAMLTAKQRNEERLALCRFVKFGYQYSQAFKVDIPLNPVIIMKIVHPYFGYLNNIPNKSQYKYTYDQIFTLIQELNVASNIRQRGFQLHSSEILSLIFWKIYNKSKAILSPSQTFDFFKIFKFNKLSQQNFKQTFKYSIKQGQFLPEDNNNIRFDLFRQIFIDRDL